MRASWPCTRADGMLYASTIAPPLIASPFLPQLAEAAQHAAPGAEGLPLIFAFLLGKRVLLYGWATSAVKLAALRSTGTAPGLGQRLEAVTREGLAPFADTQVELAELAPVVAVLDETSGAQQAAALPLLLAATLFATFFATQALTPGDPTAAPPPAFVEAVSAMMQLSTAITATFFVNAEASTLASGRGGFLPAGAAVALVAAAYLLPSSAAWPLQNIVNVCIAVGVARVAQLPQLAAVCSALAGLALYDIIFTGGAVTAAEVPSMMESVARSRLLDDRAWQPGLLVVRDGQASHHMHAHNPTAPAQTPRHAAPRRAASQLSGPDCTPSQCIPARPPPPFTSHPRCPPFLPSSRSPPPPLPPPPSPSHSASGPGD